MPPSWQLSRAISISVRPGTRLCSRFHSQMAMRSSVGSSRPLDLIQEAMVERLPRLGQAPPHIVEVQHAAGVGIGLAVDGDAGAERMAMDPCVRMAWRGADGRKWAASKLEFLIDAHGLVLGDFWRQFQGPGLSGQAEQLVGLQAQAPFGVGEAIGDGHARMCPRSSARRPSAAEEMGEVPGRSSAAGRAPACG